MFSKRSALFALAALPFAFTAALAADPAPFTQAAFDAALNAKTPVLVEIHADWCPTCKAQAPIIKSLTEQSKFSGMAILLVDFDTQKDIVRQFGAQQQSTLIVFKDGKEVARSVGETGLVPISELLGKGV